MRRAALRSRAGESAAQDVREAGDEALRGALRCVRARASDIPEAEARERFLSQVPENARTLELARQRWGEAEGAA